MIRTAALLVACIVASACSSWCPRRAPAPALPDSEIEATFERGVDAELQARSLSGEERRRMQDRALAAYDQVLASASNDSATLSNRANIKAERGDLPGAIRDFDAAILHASGPERAFYFRRSGDVLAQAGRSAQSTLSYWQALQWHPREHEAHEQIVKRLRSSPAIQITNYLRFLLETNQTERVIAATSALGPASGSPDAAAAAAAALAQSARIVPPEQLERIAEPFLQQSSEAGRNIRAVLRAEPGEFSWLERQDGAATTTGQPPHASFRGLARVMGTAAAARGDLEFAEREFRLATTMPGADASDLSALFEFHAQYQTLPELRTIIEGEEPRVTARTPADATAFHRTSIRAYALFEKDACGDEKWGIRYHADRLTSLAADSPPIAHEICPAQVPNVVVGDPSCPVMFGTNDRHPHNGVLLSFPPDAAACGIERALELIAIDYQDGKMPLLVLEAEARHRAVAEKVRAELIRRGLSGDSLRVVEARRRSDRIRIRFD